MKLLASFLLVASLSACATKPPPVSTGLCQGLVLPIDDLADQIQDHQLETHEDVILSGVTVIKGFDEGCKDD